MVAELKKILGTLNPEDVDIMDEKFTMYMSNAGDKIWRNILKKIQRLSNDADLEDEKKVTTLLKSIGINPMVAEELVRPVGPVHRRRAVERCTDRRPMPQFQQLQDGLPRWKEEDSRKYSSRAQQGKSPRDRREHGRVGGKVQEVEERHRVLEGH